MPLSDSDLALSELIDQYLKMGLCLLPLKAGTKHPSVDWVQYQSRKPTPEEINKWFGPGSTFTGIGTVTGLISGVIVLDVDPRHGGMESLEKLSPLPKTQAVLTGSGGRHYYFKYPVGTQRLSNFACRLPGIDGRGDGGFIVLPPTLHPDTGKPYHWINLENLAAAPDHIIALFQGNTGPKAKKINLSTILPGVPESQRNDSAAKLAGRHFRLGAKPEEVLLLLEGWNARNSPPLPPDELHSVVDSVGKIHSRNSIPWFDGKTFLPEPLARHIASEHTLLSTPIDASGRAVSIYRYQSGAYRQEGDDFARRQITEALGERFNDNRAEQTILVLREITKVAESDLNTKSKDLINVKNGMLDWREWKLLPHDPSYRSTFQIPSDYVEDSDCADTLKFFKEIVPADTIPLLTEFLGYSLLPDTSMQSALALIGRGENGKSTFLNLWTTFLGRENVSHISLHDLEENPFRTADLMGKLLNVFFDLDSKTLKSTSLFKTIVAGDPIQAERKFAHPFSFVPFTRLAFSANEFPRSTDRSHAFFRRLKIIPFPNSFPPDKRDPNLLSKLTSPSALSGLLFLALGGLNALMRRGRFSSSDSSDAALTEYRAKCDTSFAFLSECVERDQKSWVSKRELYEYYCSWVDLHGLFKAGSVEFSVRVKDLFDGIHSGERSDSRGARFRVWNEIRKKTSV